MCHMAKPLRAFVAFDYDNDSTLRDFLFGQSKHPDTNFEMHDWSVKEPFAQSNWKDRVRTRIRASDLVVVICGERTNKATGVDVEVKIAQEESKPYFQTNSIKGPGRISRTWLMVPCEQSRSTIHCLHQPDSSELRA